MRVIDPTDPIERTWPTLRQTHLDLCAWHLYQLVKPREGLLWDELSPAQKADYRRRVLEAAQATAVHVDDPMTAPLRELLQEVWTAHRDPGSSQYNACENGECAWCGDSKKAIDAIDDALVIRAELIKWAAAAIPTLQRLSDPCPTDEQIAAWTDGGLPAGERAAVIRHASGCDRCRQLVANVITGGDDGPR